MAAGSPDKLLKATGSANLGRKLPIVAGLLMASCIITANWLESDLAVILVMSFAFFGQGMVGLGWTLISDIAPKGLGGLTGGLFNFCANLAGILTPLVIGFIVAGFGNFFYALIYIGGAALLGVVGLSVYPRRRQTYRVIAVSKGARHGD